MIISSMIFAEQRSDEWRLERLGKVTASRLNDVMAKTKSGPAAARMNYLTELVLERLTGVPTVGYQSKAMLNGIEMEPEARAAFEVETGFLVEETGFWDHPTIPMTGASPDGIIGNIDQIEATGIEIKCLEPKAHLETLLADEVPSTYDRQIQWGMACTGLLRWRFVSYNPSFPEKLRLFIKMVERDDRMIAEIEGEVRFFLAKVEEKTNSLMERMK